MLDRNVLVVEGFGFVVGDGEQARERRRHRDLVLVGIGAGEMRQRREGAGQRLLEDGGLHAGLLQDRRGDTVALIEQRRQDVLGRRLGGVFGEGQRVRRVERLLNPLGHAFDIHSHSKTETASLRVAA